jgi:hypothetical protein
MMNNHFFFVGKVSLKYGTESNHWVRPDLRSVQRDPKWRQKTCMDILQHFVYV